MKSFLVFLCVLVFGSLFTVVIDHTIGINFRGIDPNIVMIHRLVLMLFGGSLFFGAIQLMESLNKKKNKKTKLPK